MRTAKQRGGAAHASLLHGVRQAAAILLSLSVAHIAVAGTPGYVDYLYIEANEGDSSGGHAAIRFDDRTFHFQHEGPGRIRLHRQGSADFLYTYAMLGNRTIHASRVAVSPDTYALLLDEFSRRHLIQSAHFERLDALRSDVALLEVLQRRSNSAGPPRREDAIALKAIGFFLPDEPAGASDATRGSTETPQSPALRALRERVAQRYGARFLDDRIVEVHRSLEQLPVTPATAAVLEIAPDVYPIAGSSFSSQYEDRMIGLLGLEILRAAPPLRTGTTLTPQADEFRLAAPDIRKLDGFTRRLQGELVELLRSSRPDWGFALVLGMARLAALEASQESGFLILLDATQGDAAAARPLRIEDRPAVLRARAVEACDDFQRTRSSFFATDDSREADYTALEVVGNRLVAARTDEARGLQEREPGWSLPARAARRADLIVPQVGAAELAQRRAMAGAIADAYDAKLTQLYGYNLITRNCVSEIFAVIDAAMSRLPAVQAPLGAGALDLEEAVRRESCQRLGGFVKTRGTLNFIPFLSAAAVDERYTVAQHSEQPSYRRQRLAEMRRRESPWWVYWRESNTLTSTIYLPERSDSTFLFFTDDVMLPRPVFGAVNLAVGLGASAVGLLALPLDGAAQLRAGLRGVLFSLPELVFVNLRKGSMAFVERRATGSPY